MSLAPSVVLDSGPLGLVSHRRGASEEADSAWIWLGTLEAAGVKVYIPEIADYEVRRELLRLRNTAGIARLDVVKARGVYLPITTETMLLAARLWAQARQQGRPTAGAQSLDADVILAAQALSLGAPPVVVATSNVAHLSRFVVAEEWRSITA